MGLKLNTDKLKNKSSTNNTETTNSVSKGFKLSASSNKKYDLDQIIYKIRRDNSDYPLLIQIDYTNLNNKQFVELMTKYVLDEHNIPYNENNFTDYEVIRQVPNFEQELEKMCNKYYAIYYQYYGALNEGSISIDTVFETITLARDDYEEYLLSNPQVTRNVTYQVEGDNKPKFIVEEGNTDLLDNDIDSKSVLDLLEDLDNRKQDKLESGVNLKTINGQSLLGEGDIAIVGGDGDSVLSSSDMTIGNTPAEYIKYQSNPVVVDYAIYDGLGNNIFDTYITQNYFEANKAVYKAGNNITIDSDYTISATLPTKLSEFENDVGYITETLADLKYAPLTSFTSLLEEAKKYTDDALANFHISIVDEAPEAYSTFGKIYKYITVNNSNIENIKNTILDMQDIIDTKQEKLESSINIKTINGETILGSGNLTIDGNGSTIEANPIDVASERLNKLKIDGKTYDVSSDITTLISRVGSLEENKQDKLVAGQNIVIDELSNTITAVIPDLNLAEQINLSDFIKVALSDEDKTRGILFRAASKSEIDSETFQKIYNGNTIISINTSNFILDYPLLGSISPIKFTQKNNVGNSVSVFNNHLINDSNNVGFACIITRSGITQLFAIDLTVTQNQSSEDIDLSKYYTKSETDRLINELRSYIDNIGGGGVGSLKYTWSDGVLSITEPSNLVTSEIDGNVTIKFQ